MPKPDSTPARPSAWWVIAAISTLTAAVVLLCAAVVTQRAASRPVGEGELFFEDANQASDTYTGMLGADATIDDAITAIRNDLEIEAASVVDGTGTIVASTSASLTGTAVDSPFLAFANNSRMFAAAAVPVEVPIAIDGRPEWSRGDTLYEVLHPVDGGNALLLHYDISELLERRSAAAGLSGASATLAIIAAALLIISGALLIGRIRANARFRSLASEARLLEMHNLELEDRNLRLDEAREAAERALALAEEKNRIRAEFVLMINHELRTPLTSVITGTRLLAEQADHSGPEAEILEAMLHDGERLEQMIAQILAVARIENRGLASVVSDETADVVWEEASSHLPRQIETAVEVDLAAHIVRTDPRSLGQLIGSLVDNAVTHGSSTVRLRLSNERQADAALEVGTPIETGIWIAVEDDGPGIEPEFLPRAFEKFEKHGFSTGTGLGLYVARLMAEAIGSSISVSSSPSGTTMSVGIPVVDRTVTVGQPA